MLDRILNMMESLATDPDLQKEAARWMLAYRNDIIQECIDTISKETSLEPKMALEKMKISV